MSDIERDLEFELHRVLDPVASTPIPVRRSIRPRGPVKTLLGGAGAALTIKILTGVAVAAAAVTVAGAATTHSLNPSVWGQQVKQQVETCKDQLAQGDHGIGDCVSGFANQHGQSVASDARQHGNGNGASKDKNGNGNGNSKSDNDNSKDKPKESPSTDTMEPTDPSSHATPRVSPRP
jgi:hypothetical protein